MAKETFYFTHDYNARNDDKILELRSAYGAEGYGIFWMIVETMAENENGGLKATLIGGLSLGYGLTKGRLLEFIKYCVEVGLFYEKEGFYFSRRMLSHKEFRNKLSAGGKAGADKRWAGYSPPNGSPNAKERKGNKSKVINNSDFVCYNAEDYLLNDRLNFEKICIATGKTEKEVKTELHSYHLWMEKNENYPVGKRAIVAGVESWILNGKNFKRAVQDKADKNTWM